MEAPKEITQRDLRNRSAEIMDAVSGGETFIVTRSGEPIGELIPLRRRHFVAREEFIAMGRNLPSIDLERFRADQDRHIDQELRDPYDR